MTITFRFRLFTLKRAKSLITVLFLLVCCAGCERPAPAWVQLACAYMVQDHRYPDQASCLAAARRDGAY
jgi:hypothetical protein